MNLSTFRLNFFFFFFFKHGISGRQAGGLPEDAADEMKKHADNLTLSQFGVANDKQETETQETVCRGRDYSGLDLKTHSHSFGFFFFFF